MPSMMNKSKLLNIAVVTSSYTRFPGDGIAPFVKAISESLAGLGHNLAVVAPYDPDVKPLDTDDIQVYRYKYIWPIRFHVMGHARSLEKDVRLRLSSYILLPFFLIAAFIKLNQVVKHQNSDIIYAHWVIPNGLIASCVAKLRNIPFIISLHGSDIYVAQKNWLFRTIARWVFKHSSGVTACSAELNRKAVELGAPKDINLVPWGADPTIFDPRRRTRATGNQLNNQSQIRITSLGRMVEKKGFKFLIEAMPPILQKFPSTELVIGGGGLLQSDLQKQTQDFQISERVSFPGSVLWNDVPEFLANSDIFVLPSVRDEHGNEDGLPTVLLEAMSCGVAVIASQIGGTNLVIQNDVNGLLVPPGDIPSLTRAIMRLIQNEELRKNLGREARISVMNRFNWNEVAVQISAILQTSVASME
jgi:glycosyltransferase involved in cell wall biosynthesis